MFFTEADSEFQLTVHTYMDPTARASLTLPNELLIRIFQTFVEETSNHSPVVLTHVCQLWRQLAHGTSSLWTFIDLYFYQRAKHHLAFAQQQPLVVSWQCVMKSPRQLIALPDLEDYEDIFSQASRFIRLNLLLHGRHIAEVFDRLNHHGLLNLQLLVLAGTAWSWGKFTASSMPKLRHLFLSSVSAFALSSWEYDS